MIMDPWISVRLNCRKLIREVLKEFGLWHRGMLNRKHDPRFAEMRQRYMREEELHRSIEP